MNMMTSPQNEQPISGGFRVDVSCGQRIGRVSSEWFARPDDERFLNLPDLYEAVRLTIQGRFCTMDVLEVPDSKPVLIGQIPQLHLDFVIDPRSRTLTGNPAHGGEHVYELY